MNNVSPKASSSTTSLNFPNLPTVIEADFKDLLSCIDTIKAKCAEIFGFSYVQNIETGKWVPVVITKQAKEQCLTIFTIYLCANKILTEMGSAYAYLECENKPPEIFLGFIRTSGSEMFKYRGYLMIKAVQQNFQQITEGRMYLESNPKADGFYEKLGFTPYRDIGKMYKLLPESRVEWFKEIQRNPILSAIMR